MSEPVLGPVLKEFGDWAVDKLDTLFGLKNPPKLEEAWRIGLREVRERAEKCRDEHKNQDPLVDALREQLVATMSKLDNANKHIDTLQLDVQHLRSLLDRPQPLRAACHECGVTANCLLSDEDRGFARVEVDRMWRSPKMRRLFESELSFVPLVTQFGTERDAQIESGHYESYETAFKNWAYRRIVQKWAICNANESGMEGQGAG